MEYFFSVAVTLFPLPMLCFSCCDSYFSGAFSVSSAHAVFIFQVVWSLMLNYHQIIKWHEQYDPAMHVSEAEQEEPSAEATYNKNYIQQKLEHGLNRIWKVGSLCSV